MGNVPLRFFQCKLGEIRHGTKVRLPESRAERRGRYSGTKPLRVPAGLTAGLCNVRWRRRGLLAALGEGVMRFTLLHLGRE